MPRVVFWAVVILLCGVRAAIGQTPTLACPTEPVGATLEASIEAFEPETTFTLSLRPEAGDWPSTVTTVYWNSDFGFSQTTSTTSLDLVIPEPAPGSVLFTARAEGEPPDPNCTVWETELASLSVPLAAQTPTSEPLILEIQSVEDYFSWYGMFVDVEAGGELLMTQRIDLLSSAPVALDIPLVSEETIISYRMSSDRGSRTEINVDLRRGETLLRQGHYEANLVRHRVHLLSDATTSTLLERTVPFTFDITLGDEGATVYIIGDDAPRGLLDKSIDARFLSYRWDFDLYPDCYTVGASAYDSGGPFFDGSGGQGTLRGGGGEISVGAGDQCFQYCRGSYSRWPVKVSLNGCLFGEDALDSCPGEFGVFQLDCSHVSACSPSPTPICPSNPDPPHIESSVDRFQPGIVFTLSLVPEEPGWPSPIDAVYWESSDGLAETTQLTSIDVIVPQPAPESVSFNVRVEGSNPTTPAHHGKLNRRL
ncbi:hypothetical protein KQI84_07155 [bacterium]|nr:hypothetical protein [bacterium]